MYTILHPRMISQMEMKILRLLKSRSDTERGEVDDDVVDDEGVEEEDGRRNKRKR